MVNASEEYPIVNPPLPSLVDVSSCLGRSLTEVSCRLTFHPLAFQVLTGIVEFDASGVRIKVVNKG